MPFPSSEMGKGFTGVRGVILPRTRVFAVPSDGSEEKRRDLMDQRDAELTADVVSASIGELGSIATEFSSKSKPSCSWVSRVSIFISNAASSLETDPSPQRSLAPKDDSSSC